jgi:hypothetical protein
MGVSNDFQIMLVSWTGDIFSAKPDMQLPVALVRASPRDCFLRFLFFPIGKLFPIGKNRSSLKYHFSIEIFCISTAGVRNPPRKGALQGAVDRSSRIASACWLNWVQLLLTRCMPHSSLWTIFLPLQF